MNSKQKKLEGTRTQDYGSGLNSKGRKTDEDCINGGESARIRHRRWRDVMNPTG